MSLTFDTSCSQQLYVAMCLLNVSPSKLWVNVSLRYHFHNILQHISRCACTAGFRVSACTHGDTFCHLNFRIKCYARFFLLPFSQTEQEMSKLKIKFLSKIIISYLLDMHRMFSACASADNTVNNPALLLICAKTLFELSSLNQNFWIVEVRSCIYKIWIVCLDSVQYVTKILTLGLIFQSRLFRMNPKYREKCNLRGCKKTQMWLFSLLYWTIQRCVVTKIDDIPWTQVAEVSWAAPFPSLHTHQDVHLRLSHPQRKKKKKTHPTHSLFFPHTTEHLCMLTKWAPRSHVHVMILSQDSIVFTHCDQYRNCNKWFVHKYYCITGSANQICSDWICWRRRECGNQSSIYLCKMKSLF